VAGLADSETAEEGRFLPGMTPEALMRSCANLSGLQRAAFAEPLKGSRLQFTGPATIITPAPIGGVNMTMVLQGDDQNFDAFLHFPGDVEALSRLRVNEQITVEGQLKSIELGTINFDQCRLLSSTEQREPRRFDPATVEKPRMHEAIAAARAETTATARAPVPLSAPEPAITPTKGNLPASEYERLGRAIAAGWGTMITEETAWARAKAIFPQHSVRKREFFGVIPA